MKAILKLHFLKGIFNTTKTPYESRLRATIGRKDLTIFPARVNICTYQIHYKNMRGGRPNQRMTLVMPRLRSNIVARRRIKRIYRVFSTRVFIGKGSMALSSSSMLPSYIFGENCLEKKTINLPCPGYQYLIWDCGWEEL